MNHGDAWIHRARIISLDYNQNAALIKWLSSGKRNYVKITDLKKNSELETSQRKQKAAEFLHCLPSDACTKRNKEGILGACVNSAMDSVRVRNKFYSIENLSKFRAEDANKLLSMLNYSQSDIDSFWNLCNAPVSEVMEQLHTKFIPKAVLNTSCVVNQIKKCIWILQIKFNIGTTSKIRTSCLTSV